MHFSILHPANKTAIEDFEKSFYSVFSQLEKQKLLRQIWDWDDEKQRIALRMPYTEQLIYAWRDTKGMPVCYVAGTLGNSFSQFKFYGFDTPTEAQSPCEVLTLFTLPGRRMNGFKLNKLFLTAFCKKHSRSLGSDSLLATCTPAVLPGYLRWGWQLKDTREIEGEKRHLLYFDLKQIDALNFEK